MIWYILFTSVVSLILAMVCDEVEIDGAYKYLIGFTYGGFVVLGYFLQYVQ